MNLVDQVNIILKITDNFVILRFVVLFTNFCRRKLLVKKGITLGIKSINCPFLSSNSYQTWFSRLVSTYLSIRTIHKIDGLDIVTAKIFSVRHKRTSYIRRIRE